VSMLFEIIQYRSVPFYSDNLLFINNSAEIEEINKT
jgi:hypothetical protein